MTPKEKAFQLINRYLDVNEEQEFNTPRYLTKEEAVEGALIAVDEILESQPRYPSEVDWDDCGGTHEQYGCAQREEAEKFWQEVKQELKNK